MYSIGTLSAWSKGTLSLGSSKTLKIQSNFSFLVLSISGRVPDVSLGCISDNFLSP